MDESSHFDHPTPATTSSNGSAPSAPSAPQAASAAHHHGLNPRSCVTCRKRKVKCDRIDPCTNCTKQGIQCVFPAPGRAPRRARKAPDNELLARLRTLESVVKHLSHTDHQDPQPTRPGPRDPNLQNGVGAPPTTRTPPHRADSLGTALDNRKRDSIDSNFGRLVIEEGRSRYVSNSYWANLSNEVEDLKSILHRGYSEDEDELDAEDFVPHDFPNDSPHHGGGDSLVGNSFMFGYRSASKDLSSLHPRPELLLKLWSIYEEHCDPLVKMLHIPSMRKTINLYKDDPATCPQSMEPLFFAIYFAAITSLTEEECARVTGTSRNESVAKYRFAVEQSLARAHFLTSEELTVLQAFVMFLICLRRHEDARVIWSLCGLVVRIAMTLGLHRDPEHFELSPFDVEIRRRTWWQICILDVRTSEDHGSNPSIVEHTFDTKFPLNINDEDLTPDMEALPQEREGVAEMTFCLIRITVCNTFRRLSYDPPPSSTCFDMWSRVTLEDKERWVEECHKHLEEKYLKHCRMDEPMEWVICTVARLIMAKMWLIIYHPLQRQDGGASLNPETRDRLFITSLESIEYALLLETEVKTVKWGWLFRTYCQWHALAFLLSELCVRTRGVTVQRAWRAVDATVVEWGGKLTYRQKSYLWRPLRKLLAKAREARERELASDKLLSTTPLINMHVRGSADSAVPDSARQNPASQVLPNGNTSTETSWSTAGNQPSGVGFNTLPSTNDGFSSMAAFQETTGMNENKLQLPGQTGSGFEIANSPFFANHPPVDASRWDTYSSSGQNQNPLDDWFMGGDASEAMALDGNMQLDNLMGTEVGAPSKDTLIQSPAQGQGKPEIQWEDWDAMVRNLEMETGMTASSMNNNSSASAGVPNCQNANGGNLANGNGWRRALMGETWL